MFYIISPVVLMGLLVLIKLTIAPKLTYNKAEKLKSRKLIEHLFSKGKSISAFPVKVLYDLVEHTGMPLQAGVTVSSRRFKKAVERNRVKRVMREAYRLQKQHLASVLEGEQESLVLFFIFIGKELPVFAEVNEKMQVVLQKLSENILNKPIKN